MSFKDAFKENGEKHVDTPAQAEARAKAMAEVKAKAEAKAARAAAHRAGKHRRFMTPTDATGKTGPAGERSKDRSAPVRVSWDPGEPQPAVGPRVERCDDDESKKGLGDAYRKLEPYMAASSTLVGSVAGFTALGYWLDRKMGHSVQWLLLVGAVVGMVIGFVGFFTKLRTAGKR